MTYYIIFVSFTSPVARRTYGRSEDSATAQKNHSQKTETTTSLEKKSIQKLRFVTKDKTNFRENFLYMVARSYGLIHRINFSHVTLSPSVKDRFNRLFLHLGTDQIFSQTVTLVPKDDKTLFYNYNKIKVKLVKMSGLITRT